MSDLISRSALIEDMQKELEKAVNEDLQEDECKAILTSAIALKSFVNRQPTFDAVPLSEIYRVIAGHSYYHGDNILAALTCIAEGKEVKPIKPVDAVPVVHAEWIKGGLGEWKCSVCREENCYAYDENLKRFTDLYCPQCGAKMDGKKVQE